jgi:hypothetical protein
MFELRFRHRRWLALAVTVLAAVVFWTSCQQIAQRLGRPSYFSGFTLLACVGGLMLIGFRKRLVMLPLLSVSTWTQIHIYTGLFATVVYLAHVPRIVGGGVFESVLSVLFLSVSASGFYGLYLSRTAPKRLTAVPGEFRFDQIGWHRQRINDRATDLLLGLDASMAAPVLVQYFRSSLESYFSAGVPLAYLVAPTGHRRRRLLLGLNELERYMSRDVQAVSGQLAGLVRKRDELDFHFAIQLRLRLWVAVHATLATLLVVASLVHVVIVLNFI